MNRELSIDERRIRLHRSNQAIGPAGEHLQIWRRNHRTRQKLARLDDEQLADLGLSAVDRRIECRKWFWQK